MFEIEMAHMEDKDKHFSGNFSSQNLFLVVYKATLVDLDASFVLAKDEIAEVRFVDATEYKTLSIWPAFTRTLDTYFDPKNRYNP